MDLHLANVLLFFTYLYGLGYAVCRFWEERTLESHLVRLGVGLGALPVLGIILNRFRLPMDWQIFFTAALIVPVHDLIRSRPALSWPRLTRPGPKIILLTVILVFCLILYCGGAFLYPYLEDDDSWDHATSIKFITVEKTLQAPPRTFQYLNPYPPGYDLVMAVMHQTHPSLYWTMKFFNGLVVSLSILFFFTFAKEFLRNEEQALIATALLAMTPCYLTHFIWAHSLVVTLFFPALFCLIRCQKDPRFRLPAATVIAGIFLTQPTQSIKFVILILIYLLAWGGAERRVPRTALQALLVAALVSLLWWAPVIKDMAGNSSVLLERSVSSLYQKTHSTPHILGRLFAPDGGSATRSYSLIHFLVAPRENLINSPIGFGPTLCFLALLGLPLMTSRLKGGGREHQPLVFTVLGWLIFTFLGVNSQTFHLPVGLFAFRFWMLLAVPVSLLASETLSRLPLMIKQKHLRQAFVILALVGVTHGSGWNKADINFSFWKWGIYWTSKQELKLHVWMREHLPADTRVFRFTDNQLVIGHDMLSAFWTERYRKSFAGAFVLPIEDLHRRLREEGFSHLIVSSRDIITFGQEPVNQKIETLKTSGLFREVFAMKNGGVLLQVI